MANTRPNDIHAQAAGFSSRSTAVAMLSQSGVVVSKTGGAYRDPAAIIRSSMAQDQLKAISAIRQHIDK